MTRTTFLQPPPPPLLEDLATGYQYRKGQNEFESVPFLYLNIVPAAAMSATATDMAHFMIAHLQGGEYEGERILEPDTVALMQEQHFVHFPGLPGSAYGFHERLENRLRGIGHAGSLRGYSSNISLFPEEDLGIFIATTTFTRNLLNSFSITIILLNLFLSLLTQRQTFNRNALAELIVMLNIPKVRLRNFLPLLVI
jgi:CubicO group peptidase (beta-lactamase class C family)